MEAPARQRQLTKPSPILKASGKKIRPLVYDTVLKRAETRMLNLHKKIESAPFLANNPEITEFLEKNTVASHEQLSLANLVNDQ